MALGLLLNQFNSYRTVADRSIWSSGLDDAQLQIDIPPLPPCKSWQHTYSSLSKFLLRTDLIPGYQRRPQELQQPRP